MNETTLKAAAITVLLLPCWSWAAPSTTDDRIAVSADGSTLTGTNGGAGGSITWLHNFDTDTLAAVAVEHQKLATAQWTFGSLTGSLTRGTADQRYSFYGEVHEGSGTDTPGSFHYGNVAAGVIGTYFHQLSVQIEDRQFDILTSHGNLPKVQVSYLWTPHLQTAVSFANSVSGNLGTHLFAARLDRYGRRINLLAGLSYGRTTPAVLNSAGIPIVPGATLREGYVGLTGLFPDQRSELSAIADYQDLSGSSKRAIFTLNYIVHVGGSRSRR